MIRSFLRLSFAVFLITSVHGATPVPAVDVIPVETFAESPRLSHARLSPDGRHVASLLENDGKTWLVVMDLETRKLVRINPGTTRGGLSKEIGAFRWVSDKRIGFLTATASNARKNRAKLFTAMERFLAQHLAAR